MKTLLIAIIFLLFISFCSNGQNCNYEGYYLLQSVYPNNENAFWFPNDTEVQGVANDGKNWFITTTGHVDFYGADEWGKLWRIPKSVPLGANSTSNPNVAYIEMDNIPELSNGTAWHWGDPDHYEYEGVDYILVPISKNEKMIACFTAEPLEFVSYTPISFGPGWCAIDKDGFLYSSKDSPGEEGHKSIRKYEVNWEVLTSSSIGCSV